jgi:hypothetical protein
MSFGIVAVALGASAATGAAVGAVGSAAIGAYGSNRAAKKGADAAQRGQDIIAQGQTQGRADVMGQFPQAQQAQTRGFEEFRDFLSNQVMPAQSQPFIGGNMAAQEQISRGLPQIQNALLGNAIDTSGFQARQIGQAPTFDMSKFGPQAPAAQPQFDFNQIDIGRFGGGGGNFDPYNAQGRGRFSNMNTRRNVP